MALGTPPPEWTGDLLGPIRVLTSGVHWQVQSSVHLLNGRVAAFDPQNTAIIDSGLSLCKALLYWHDNHLGSCSDIFNYSIRRVG